MNLNILHPIMLSRALSQLSRPVILINIKMVLYVQEDAEKHDGVQGFKCK